MAQMVEGLIRVLHDKRIEKISVVWQDSIRASWSWDIMPSSTSNRLSSIFSGSYSSLPRKTRMPKIFGSSAPLKLPYTPMS